MCIAALFVLDEMTVQHLDIFVFFLVNNAPWSRSSNFDFSLTSNSFVACAICCRLIIKDRLCVGSLQTSCKYDAVKHFFKQILKLENCKILSLAEGLAAMLLFRESGV